MKPFQERICRIFRGRSQKPAKEATALQRISSKPTQSSSDVSSIKSEATLNACPGVKDTSLKTSRSACHSGYPRSSSWRPICSPPKKDFYEPGDLYKLQPMPTIPASQLKKLFDQDTADIIDRKLRRNIVQDRLIDAKRAQEDILGTEETLEQTLPTVTVQEESGLDSTIPVITLTAAECSQPTMDACTWAVIGMKTWGSVEVDITIRPPKSRKSNAE